MIYWFITKYILEFVLIINMKSLHSAQELKIDTDPYKLIKKLSPRNTDTKKTWNNFPTFKSTSSNSNKKLTKDIKKSLN